MPAKLQRNHSHNTNLKTISFKYVWVHCLSQAYEENGMPEPRTDQQHHLLWDTLPTLSTFVSKGPMCKLMRWFSFNDCAKEYHGGDSDAATLKGQLWATKMVLEHHFNTTSEQDDAPKPMLPTKDEEPKEELRKLKAQTGAMKLAPQLITDANMWVLDLIMAVSDASWYAYGDKAKNVKSVEHSVTDAISEQQGQWQSELVGLVAGCLNGAHNRKYFTKLGLLDCNYDQAVLKTSKLVNIVLLIIHHRARSGSSLASLFPHRTLTPKPATSSANTQSQTKCNTKSTHNALGMRLWLHQTLWKPKQPWTS